MKLLTQNIMGTPAMKMARVTHDLRHVRDSGVSAVGFQEIKWPWYWVALSREFKGWGRYPRAFKGAYSAQPIVWDKSKLRAVKHQVRILHKGSSFTLARYQRAVLLEEIATGRCFWIKNKHYLPGYAGRAPIGRRRIGASARANDKRFTEDLLQTGYPVIDVGDYNERGHVFGGGHEYVVTNDIDQIIVSRPSKPKNGLRVKGHSLLSIKQLYTDHDGQIVDFDLLP